MPDLKISVDIDARGTKAGADQAKAAIKGIGDEAEKTQRRSRSVLDIDFKAAADKLRNVSQTMKNVGAGMQYVGRSASIAITAPLAALATLGIKSALELDSVRTKLTALLGSAEAANKKMIELRKLSAESVGVTQQQAEDAYVQLRGIGGIADASINRVITSMGKLNAAFKLDDVAGFNRNLVQIFSQGFERADIKEALGRVPIFEQILESAFGTKDPAKLNALKKAGALTLDGFMTGMADAIEKDPRIANITESLSTKLAKGWERLNRSLAPLGQIILDKVIPIFEQLVPVVEEASKWFASLSPAVQTALVAFGALAAALGPVLIIVGSIVGAVGTLVSAFSAIAAAIGGSAGLLGIAIVLTGIGEAIAPLIVWLGLLYAAWQTNFGGIRELTATVAAAIQEAWNIMMAALSDLTQTVLAEVKQFWQENGDEIMEIVNAFSEAFKEAWTAIVTFWKENHEQIETIAKTVWDFIKDFIVGAIRFVGNAIKVALGLINGDWEKAWEGTKGILRAVIDVWKSLINNGTGAVIAAVRALFQGIWDLGSWVNEQAAKLAGYLVQGLINGMRAQVDAVAGAARYLGNAAINALKAAIRSESPSKATMELGVFFAEGLADGIDAGAPEAAKAASTLGSRMTDVLQQILGGDLKDVLSRTIDVLSDSSRSWGDRLKTVFGGIAQNFRRMATDMVSTWIATLLHLNTGGQGQGPGGTPNFNPNGGGIFGGGSGGGIFGGSGGGIPPTGTIDSDGNYTVNGNQGGGIFGGGLFKPPTNPFTGKTQSGLSGVLSGIGSIASVVGGFIPGRAGNIVSYAGQGLSIGAMFGPWGALIGAGIGALIGFFMGNPKEKRDKKEKLPALQQGFSDSMSQLRQLVGDIRALRVNPDSGLAKAIELRGQIASGFGLQFESKKYQKQAQQLIAQQLIEADALVAEIRNAADVARAAGERERRMLPEFAGGVYMSPAFMSFRRQNGLLGGAWTGRDTIPAMLAHGEMVLNPTQQNRVRAAAGFDVFKPAGIPGYAGGGMVDASGGGQPIVLQVSHTIDRDGMVQTAVKSPSGRRVILDVVSDGFANDDLKLKRRGA